MTEMSEKTTNGTTPKNVPYVFSPKTVPKAQGQKIFTYLAKKLSISSRSGSKSVKPNQSKRKKGCSLLKKTLIAQAKRTAAITLSLSSLSFSNHDEDSRKNQLEGPDNIKYSSYALDIYSYLKELEGRYALPSDYLRGKSSDVVNMRNVVADWLIRVHSFCHLHLETYYLAMGIVDRYVHVKDLTITEFKTLGVTALLIATKYEEKFNPKLRPFGVDTSHFNQADINDLEIKILRTLDFKISFPVPVTFFRLLCKLANVTSTERDMGRYVMELSVCNHQLAASPPSLYAAAALYLTLRISRNYFEWNNILQEVSEYQVEDMMSIVQDMSDHLIKSHSRKFRYTAAKEKYAQDLFHRVSALPHFQSALVHSFAKSGGS